MSGTSEEGGPEVSIVAQAWQEEQRKGAERYAIALKEHEVKAERLFALSDALVDLSDEEVVMLEYEVLPEFPPQLSASACSASLTMLGMRLGKMVSKSPRTPPARTACAPLAHGWWA